MPTNIVKTEKEDRLWGKAKAAAASEGHTKDWPYVVGIYKKMNPERFEKGAETNMDSVFIQSLLRGFEDGLSEKIAGAYPSVITRAGVNAAARAAEKAKLRKVIEMRNIKNILPDASLRLAQNRPGNIPFKAYRVKGVGNA